MAKSSEHPGAIFIQPASPSKKGGEEINYKEILHKYFLSKWYFYLLSLILFVGLGYFYVQITPPVYEVTAKLFIKEKSNNYGSNDDWIKENLNFMVASENVKNEIEVLTSVSLIESVIEDFELDKKYFWENNLLQNEAYGYFPVKVDTFNPSPAAYLGIKFDLRPGPSAEEFLFTTDTLEEVHTFGEWFTNTLGDFKITKAESNAFEEDSILHVELHNLRDITEHYSGNYSVAFADSKMTSSTLILTLNDNIPERGEDFLTRLIENYRERKVVENREIANRTMDFIDDRLAQVSQDLRSVESNVEQFKISQDIASETTSDLSIMLENLNRVSNQQKDLEVQLSAVGSTKRSIGQQGDEFELIPTNLAIENTPLDDLLKSYNDLVLRRKQLLMSAQPSNPRVIAANQDLQSLRSSIRQTVQRMEDDLQLQLNVKRTQQADLSERLKSVPRKERELSDRSRKQEITEQLYNFLLRKKEEMSLAFLTELTDFNVMDPPRAGLYPVSPKDKLIYFGSFLSGLAFPFVFFFLKDLIRDSVLDEKEIKTLLPGMKILGAITKYKGKEKLVVLRQRNTITAEQFRSLRINVRFMHKQSPIVIMVSSSTSGEGKTFVTGNLSTSFSLTDKKVVVLDFDLYKGDLTKFLEEPAEIGLTDYLTGSAFVEDIIQPSQNIPNLDFVGSGPLLTMKSELFTEDKLNELFTYLRAKYDIILVDTPPIGIISDAILINQYINVSLFVVRSGSTKKELLKRTSTILEMQQVSNPSIVLNGVKESASYGRGYGAYKKYIKGTA